MATIHSQITTAGETPRVTFHTDQAEGFTLAELDALEHAISYARHQLEHAQQAARDRHAEQLTKLVPVPT